MLSRNLLCGKAPVGVLCPRDPFLQECGRLIWIKSSKHSGLPWSFGPLTCLGETMENGSMGNADTALLGESYWSQWKSSIEMPPKIFNCMARPNRLDCRNKRLRKNKGISNLGS